MRDKYFVVFFTIKLIVKNIFDVLFLIWIVCIVKHDKCSVIFHNMQT